MPAKSESWSGKVIALQSRLGTAAEQQAAEATLERPLATGLSAEREPLSDIIIKRLPSPERGNKPHWDSAVPGFGVIVTAAGAKSFIFNYRTKAGRQRRFTIGAFPNWTTGAARIEARQLRRVVDQGGDPLADLEADREAPAVDELIARFAHEHLPRRRASTAADYRSMISKHIAPTLGHFKVAEVTFADVNRLHHRLTASGSPYRANRVIAVLSKMFALAVRWGMCEANPCKGIEKNKEYHRRRYLKFDELTALLKALAAYSDQRIADVFRLLLMTGARRGEVLSMRWADLELGNAPDTAIWSKPPASTKQKEQHEVPLSGPARQLLMEARQRQTANRRTLPEFVFNGSGQKGHVVEVKRAWRSICKVAGITNLRIHDLRHSFASQAISDGASLPLVGALLGHFNPSTTQRYAHMLTDPQRRTVENVGAVITAAANGGPSTEPTPFKRTPSKRRRS